MRNRRFKCQAVAVKLGLFLALFACSTATIRAAAAPDFGPNVLVFSPSMPAAAIQEQIDKVYAIQAKAQFGSERYALLFQPGTYNVDIPVGFYTHVIGLGAAPDSVHIKGKVHSDAYLSNNNSTCNFWRAVEPRSGDLKPPAARQVADNERDERGKRVERPFTLRVSSKGSRWSTRHRTGSRRWADRCRCTGRKIPASVHTGC